MKPAKSKPGPRCSQPREGAERASRLPFVAGDDDLRDLAGGQIGPEHDAPAFPSIPPTATIRADRRHKSARPRRHRPCASASARLPSAGNRLRWRQGGRPNRRHGRSGGNARPRMGNEPETGNQLVGVKHGILRRGAIRAGNHRPSRRDRRRSTMRRSALPSPSVSAPPACRHSAADAQFARLAGKGGPPDEGEIVARRRAIGIDPRQVDDIEARAEIGDAVARCPARPESPMAVKTNWSAPLPPDRVSAPESPINRSEARPPVRRLAASSPSSKVVVIGLGCQCRVVTGRSVRAGPVARKSSMCPGVTEKRSARRQWRARFRRPAIDAGNALDGAGRIGIVAAS